MNGRQMKFCELLAKMGSDPDIDSQGKAYMDAGYKVKSMEVASVNASRLLTDAKVRAYYEELLEAVKSKSIASIAEVQEFFTKAMRGEIEEEVVMITEDGLERANKQIVPRDRVAAAQNMGKILNLYAADNKGKTSVVVTFADDIGDGDEE